MMTIVWDKLCRLCANIESDITLFSEDGESKGFVKIISKYLSIQISAEDPYSSKICKDCSEKVSAFDMFASQCLKIQQVFEKHFNQTEIENEIHLHNLITECKVYIADTKLIKTEVDSLDTDFDGDNYIHDDLDYVPLANLEDCKPKKKTKKRGRPKKKFLFDTDRSSNEINVHQEIEVLLEDDCKTFKHRKKIKLEMGDSEYNSENNKVKRKNKINYSDSDVSIFRFTCHICKLDCRNWLKLRSHTKKVHKCPAKVLCVCLKYLSSRNSLLKHIQKHDPSKALRCPSCPRTFANQRELNNHSITHLPKDMLPFVCCKCGKRFSTQRILHVHEQTHKPPEERFVWPCTHCGSKFASKGALGTHIRVIHEKLKPYICDLCGHASSTKANLQEHHAKHGEAKNFECDKCMKNFKTKGALVRHLDTHGDTAYQCPHCPQLLNSRRTLRNHLFVHDDSASHVCPFCGKAFKRKKSIKCHMKLHTGERPYSCPWCSRTFTNGSNCRIHKRRMHPNEFQLAEAVNPFAPSNCEKEPPKKVIHATIKIPSKQSVIDINVSSTEDVVKNVPDEHKEKVKTESSPIQMS